VSRVSCLVSRFPLLSAFRQPSDTTRIRQYIRIMPSVPSIQHKRRSHRKSKAGCVQCRRRRIKVRQNYLSFRTAYGIHPIWHILCVDTLICPRGGVAQCDEQDLKCSGCIRRSISCVYLVCRDTRSSSSSDGGSFGRRLILSPHPAEGTCFSSSSTVAKQGPQACLTLFTMGDLSLLHHWTLSTHLSISELDVKVGSLELM
jgi:hypothetical protein